jgi:hypothetical protein
MFSLAKLEMLSKGDLNKWLPSIHVIASSCNPIYRLTFLPCLLTKKISFLNRETTDRRIQIRNRALGITMDFSSFRVNSMYDSVSSHESGALTELTSLRHR